MMEKVLGIGGLFFKSQDPAALSAWYDKHLGINIAPTAYDQEVWQQQAGETVFAPFAQDSEYFGQASQRWMINFRVRDLDAMIAQLKDAGIAAVRDPQAYPNGSFARLHDPDGNPIELWQPKQP